MNNHTVNEFLTWDSWIASFWEVMNVIKAVLKNWKKKVILQILKIQQRYDMLTI
jgi:hypothetical protein